MKIPVFRLLGLPVAVLLVAGCATVNPRPDYDATRRHVEKAVGQPWTYRPEDGAGAEATVEGLLADGLSADEAVQLCLLNNPRIQSELLKVGISRADVVQSGLFSNPSLSLSLRWPDGGGLTNLEFGLAQNIAELWQLPFRSEAATRELERVILEVAREASTRALEAKSAYYRALGANRELEITKENLAITKQALDLAVAKRDAGSGSDVDINLSESPHLDVQLDVQRATLAAVEARSELVVLLGLRVPPAELKLADALPSPAAWDVPADALIRTAKESRLDFKAVAMLIQAAEARIDLEKSRFLRSVELGVSAERDARGRSGDRNWLAEAAWESAGEGTLRAPSLQPRESASTDWVVGPTLAVELPLFDQNQAGVAKAEFEFQQARKALETMEQKLIQESWVAFERVRTARENTALYEQRVLPLREKSLDLATEAYRAGRTPFLSVLDAQRNFLQARAGYIEALEAYALAIVEVERVSGRPLSILQEGQ